MLNPPEAPIFLLIQQSNNSVPIAITPIKVMLHNIRSDTGVNFSNASPPSKQTILRWTIVNLVPSGVAKLSCLEIKAALKIRKNKRPKLITGGLKPR